MIVITGAAGFIGSALISRLNAEGIYNLMLVDDFSNQLKQRNYSSKKFLNTINRFEFLEWFPLQADSVEFVFHLGARTDTTEFRKEILDELNLDYSKLIFKICAENKIPLVYASSAATYGSGEFGYNDDEMLISKLQPLNPYGVSKNEFDKWVLLQNECPPFWCGLQFFNVFGPNEFHKGRMASVVMHGFNQINETGKLKLFRSHKLGVKDGEQQRDFIYVKDVVEVLRWLMNNSTPSGIYNLGAGEARTFLDLAKATFAALNLQPQIEWIDIPEDIKEKYQYYTQANMNKLRNAGFKLPFTKLEDAVSDYVRNYLQPNKIY